MKQFLAILKNVFILLRIIWKEDKLYTIGYFVTCILGSGLSIVAYIVYKQMVDKLVSATMLQTTSILFFSITTYLVVEYVSYFTYNILCTYYFDYLLRTKLQNVLTRQFMEKMAELDFAHLEDGDTRNLIAKVLDNYMWRLPDIIKTTNNIVYNISSLFFALIIALHFGSIFFLLLALVTLPFYYLRGKYGNAAYSAYTGNADKANYLWYMRNIFSNFQTLGEVKLYGLKSHFLQRTQRVQKELLTIYQKPLLKYSLVSIANYFVTPIVMFFALSNIGQSIITRHSTIGDFTLFTATIFTFSGQLAFILNNLAGIYEDNLYANDFFSLLAIKNTIVPSEKDIHLTPVIPRTIVFEHVSFSYPGNEKESLHDISLTINRGEDIAIVGHNGAGKTTLIKLLLRFYDPTSGRILVDGIDLKDIDLVSWYTHVGVLFQDFARYNLTLKENIELGNLGKTDTTSLHTALDQAQTEDVVTSLPKGIDTILGRWFKEGQELSTGQWQKVAIARALFREAPMLIMDEPTANIDAESEYNIFQNLKKIYKNKTLIFISHRFSTVRMADKIFVIDKGELIEQGTHEELRKQKGYYEKYFRLQKKGYE